MRKGTAIKKAAGDGTIGIGMTKKITFKPIDRLFYIALF
jgi:hypothetical protein